MQDTGFDVTCEKVIFSHGVNLCISFLIDCALLASSSKESSTVLSCVLLTELMAGIGVNTTKSIV